MNGYVVGGNWCLQYDQVGCKIGAVKCVLHNLKLKICLSEGVLSSSGLHQKLIFYLGHICEFGQLFIGQNLLPYISSQGAFYIMFTLEIDLGN